MSILERAVKDATVTWAIGVIWGLYWGYIRVILGVYWDSGEYNGNCCLGFRFQGFCSFFFDSLQRGFIGSSSLKGGYLGSIIGVIEGDARSLDYSSHCSCSFHPSLQDIMMIIW